MQTRIALALAVALTVRAQGSPEQLYRDAIQRFQSGDMDGAISRYQQLLTLRPESIAARTNLGVALARAGRYDEAVSQYQAALRYEPGNPTVRLNLALAYYKQARFQEALTALSQMRGSPSRQTQLLAADCELRTGDNAAVIARIQPEYDRSPDDPALAYVLGTALIREHRLEQGKAVIDRIFRTGDTAEANLLLGAAQLAAGDATGAVAILEKAIASKPELAGAWTLLGQAQVDAGRNEAARQSLGRALIADPNDFDANLRLGGLLRHDGEYSSAAVYVAHAVRLRPQSLAARFQMGAVNAALGRLEDAARDLEFVARESPQFQDVHVQLAALYFKMNRREDAQRERNRILMLNEEQRRTQVPALGSPGRR